MTTIDKLEEKYSQLGKNNHSLQIEVNKRKPKYTIIYDVWFSDKDCYMYTQQRVKHFNSLKEIDKFMGSLPEYGD